MTTAGSLSARYIFHAVTIDLDQGASPDEEVIRQATTRCMELAEALGLRTIAFPALGTGVGGFSFEGAADVMIRTVTAALDSSRTLERATIALFARAGVSQSELNQFYERAVGQVAVWQQTRRLAKSLDEFQTLPGLSEADADNLRALHAEVQAAQERLGPSADMAKELEPEADVMPLVELGQRVALTLSEVRGATERSADPRAQEAAIRAELEELRLEGNANRVLLGKLQTDQALGGAQGPESDRRIAEVTDELRELYGRIARTERRLEYLSG